MEKKYLNVILDTGEEKTINVLDIIIDNETQNEYIIYNYIDDEDIYAAKIVENDTSFLLKALEYEVEKELVKSYIDTKMSEDN
jgi:hypothetical protein